MYNPAQGTSLLPVISGAETARKERGGMARDGRENEKSGNGSTYSVGMLVSNTRLGHETRGEAATRQFRVQDVLLQSVEHVKAEHVDNECVEVT